MKFFSIAVGLLVVICANAVTPVQRTNVTLICNYPVEELVSNLWFKVYASTNISTPVSNWPVVAVISSTNATISGTNVSFKAPLVGIVQTFYAVSASNSWWQADGDFSNVALTPPIPRDIISLRLDLSGP